MTILFVILGILMILCGISCMFTPLSTFITTGYFIVILMAVFGITGLVWSITKKKYGTTFIFSILSIILSIVLLFFPNLMLLADGVLVYLTAAWFVIQGIVSIVTSVTFTRVLGSGMWVLQLIVGILGIILGCYSFFHPAVLAISMGGQRRINPKFIIKTGDASFRSELPFFYNPNFILSIRSDSLSCPISFSD